MRLVLPRTGIAGKTDSSLRDGRGLCGSGPDRSPPKLVHPSLRDEVAGARGMRVRGRAALLPRANPGGGPGRAWFDRLTTPSQADGPLSGRPGLGVSIPAAKPHQVPSTPPSKQHAWGWHEILVSWHRRPPGVTRFRHHRACPGGAMIEQPDAFAAAPEGPKTCSPPRERRAGSGWEDKPRQGR